MNLPFKCHDPLHSFLYLQGASMNSTTRGIFHQQKTLVLRHYFCHGGPLIILTLKIDSRTFIEYFAHFSPLQVKKILKPSCHSILSPCCFHLKRHSCRKNKLISSPQIINGRPLSVIRGPPSYSFWTAHAFFLILANSCVVI